MQNLFPVRFYYKKGHMTQYYVAAIMIWQNQKMAHFVKYNQQFEVKIGGVLIKGFWEFTYYLDGYIGVGW